MGAICSGSEIKGSIYKDSEKIEFLENSKRNSSDQKFRFVVPASVFVVQKDYNTFLQEYDIICELGQGLFLL